MRLPCLLLSLMSAAALAASPADGLDAIAVYAGSWQIQMHHLDTPYSKAGIEHTRLHNQCWRGQAFYACEQVVDGKPAALVVFLRGKGSGHYVTHAIPADGGHANDGTLEIQGDRWTFPWQFDDHGKTIHARVVNVFDGHDAIDFRQEYSADGVHWTAMATGRETRVR